jgi:hypothetical protein
MSPTIARIIVSAALAQEPASAGDARLLIGTIESLQESLHDLRCEFEGTLRFRGKIAEYEKVADDGLHHSFSGVFVWKRGGDVHNETWVRLAVNNQIARETLVVRMQQQQAEEYYRSNEANLGSAFIKKPGEVRLDQHDCPASIFLFDKIKRTVADESYEPGVSEDRLDGRPVTVLTIRTKRAPNTLLGRYWIDLRRNGHAIRSEGYAAGGAVSARRDIRLAPFKVGRTEVWMPVSGDSVGYMALIDKKPVVMKEPQSISHIDVVRGTLEFNKHPGPEVFTIKYKPGTPISDSLQKLEYEFGQQKIANNPTKAEVETMLTEQLAKAQEQKAELVVAPAPDGTVWATWLAWGFGSLVVAALALLWNERRRRWAE